MSKITRRRIYLGIDVHKKTYSVTAVCEGYIVKRACMPADPVTLLNFIKYHFPNDFVKSVYEAGFSGLSLHRFLIKNQVDNIVVHAASIEIAPNARSKTDKRDSKKMAEQLYAGRLKCIHIPSLQREQWRAVTRLRGSFVKEKSRIACKLKSLMFYFDLIPHNQVKRTSRKLINELVTSKFDGDIGYCIKEYCKAWIYNDNVIKNIEKRLALQAKQDNFIGDVYKDIPGIGLMSARILANELGDMLHFTSEKALYCFTGLTPREVSSGESQHLGHITHQGNPMIRQILVQNAWRAIRKSKEYAEVFERIAKNSNRKKAILGIARRMLGHARAIMKKKKENKCCSEITLALT
jgi:transposase